MTGTFFGPRMHGTGGSGLKKWRASRRQVQEVLADSEASSPGAEDNSDMENASDGENLDPEEDSRNDSSSTGSEIQSQLLLTSSQSLFLPTLSTTNVLEATSTLVPVIESPSDVPSTSSNVADTQPSTVNAQSESLTFEDALLHFQASVAESPDSSSQTASTSTMTRSTWITTTSNEALASGVTIVPIVTLVETNSALFPNNSSFGTTQGASFPLAISTPSNASSVATGTVATIPHIVHVDGLTPEQKAGTITGVTTGVVIIGMLIALSVLAYVRGGGMRGAVPDIRFPPLRTPCKTHRSQTTNEVPRDIENATVGKDDWEEIEIRDAKGDGGEDGDTRWLEKWRRDKEKMMRRPPELHFNPSLPLPPIVLEDARRTSSA